MRNSHLRQAPQREGRLASAFGLCVIARSSQGCIAWPSGNAVDGRFINEVCERCEPPLPEPSKRASNCVLCSSPMTWLKWQVLKPYRASSGNAIVNTLTARKMPPRSKGLGGAVKVSRAPLIDFCRHLRLRPPP